MAKEIGNLVRFSSEFLLDKEAWIVLTLTSVCILYPRLIPVALTGIIFIFFIRFWQKHVLSRRTPFDFSLAFFSLSLLVSLCITPEPSTTLVQTFRVLLGIALFYSIVNWVDGYVRLRSLFYLSIIAGVILALLTPWIVSWQEGDLIFFQSIYRNFILIVGDPANPNVIAGVLILFVPLMLAGYSDRDTLSWFTRIAILLSILIMILAVLLTQSRGAILSMLVSILIFIALRYRRGWILSLFCGILFFTWLLLPGNIASLNHALDNASFGGVIERFEVWSRSIYAIQEHGFTGIGMGAFDRVITSLYPYQTELLEKVDHAHSLFLQIAVDLGLIGMISWLSLLIIILYACIQLVLRQDDKFRGKGAALLAGQVAMICHGLVDSVLWGEVRSAPVVWLFWGIITSAWLEITEYKEPQAVERTNH